SGGRVGGTPFQPGENGWVSAKQRREAKIAAMLEDWCAPIGGAKALSAAERSLLSAAAQVLLRPLPKQPEAQSRLLASVRQCLSACGLLNRRDRKDSGADLSQLFEEGKRRGR